MTRHKLLVNEPSASVFKAFLLHLPEEKRQGLAAHLSKDLIDSLSSAPSPSKDPFRSIVSLEGFLLKVDQSYFLPFFQTLSKEEARLFLSALPASKQGPLSKALSLKIRPLKLSKAIKPFLLNALYRSLDPTPDLLPLVYLPKEPLTPLLYSSKKSLILLTELLGLYDLLFYIKQLIDTKQIKALKKALSPLQREFMKRKTTFSPPDTPFSLHFWDGTLKPLKQSVQKRGLLRLAKGIGGHTEGFIWHLLHHFDKGRGDLIKKHLGQGKSFEEEVLFGVTFLEERGLL